MRNENSISMTRGWVGESWRCYWPLLWRLLPIFLIIYVPCAILSTYYSRFVLGDAESFAALAKSYRFDRLLDNVIGILALTPIVLATRDWRNGRMGTWGGYLKQGFKLWGRLLVVNLLTGLLLWGLAILLLVPALIGYVYVLFACEAAVLLNLSGGAAIRESYRVIKGHWWATVGYGLITALIIIGLMVVPVVMTECASGIVEALTEDVEELSKIGSMISFGLEVVGEWLCDLAVVFGSVSGVIWFLRLRSAKDVTPEERGLVFL